MQGKIIKGIAGFYYVQTEDKLYECKAKGIFRNKKMKPLVGDNVEIDILDETEQEGNITKIYERHNELIRPAVSNVDQALIIFAAKNPKPNYNLLDRFLMMMEKQDVPVIVCFNKVDLAKEKELKLLEKVYENCGHIVRFISVKEEEGIDEIRELIHGKTTVLAGPSGVGKSSLMNLLQPEAQMETGDARAEDYMGIADGSIGERGSQRVGRGAPGGSSSDAADGRGERGGRVRGATCAYARSGREAAGGAQRPPSGTGLSDGARAGEDSPATGP